MRFDKSPRPQRGIIVVTVVAVLAAVGAGVAVAATSHGGAVPTHVTVGVTGGGSFAPNRSFDETMHFTKANLTIRSGGKLTFRDGPGLRFPDPHTLTIARPSQIPHSALAVATCGNNPTSICSIAGGQRTPFVDVGKPGLDEPGDSLALPPGMHGIPHATFTVTVTASKGSTLHFLCVVHPWMQGVIHVK